MSSETGALKAKLRTLTREIVVEQHFPAEKQLTSGSGFQEDVGSDSPQFTAWQ